LAIKQGLADLKSGKKKSLSNKKATLDSVLAKHTTKSQIGKISSDLCRHSVSLRQGYLPENAETLANRVGRVEQLLFQFLEKVSKALKNMFAMVRKKWIFLRLLWREFSRRFRVSQ
jgi:flagellar biosynthesis component FlhA